KKRKKMGIKHWSHEHDELQMRNYDDFPCDDDQLLLCDACGKDVEGPTYVCSEDAYAFALHESCFESSASYPPQVLHPNLHPHPLLLMSAYPDRPFLHGYVCAVCHYLSCGFLFRCGECDFNVDVHCASMREIDCVNLWSERKIGITHFIHPNHYLESFHSTLPHVYCQFCSGEIRGAAFGCCDCGVSLHDSCAQLGGAIEHPYHPDHSLYVHRLMEHDLQCSACRSPLVPQSSYTAYYCCSKCKFHLHLSCAKRYLYSSPLKHKCHPHNLYYMEKRARKGLSCIASAVGKPLHIDQDYFKTFEV
ncbi:hypothetical protein Tsubulata_009404, partial [Turnera subulata]